MSFSVIQKSELEGAHRLDAEYYRTKFLDLINKIKDYKFKNIGNVCNILRGNTPKEYGNFEVPIIRSGDLSYKFINDEEKLLKTKNENIFFLKNSDILISSIGFGSIGKVNIFNGGNNKFGTVSEVSVLRDCKINSYFVWAFLASKFGQFQINREITGATGQLHLNTGNIENIIIPVIQSKKIQEIENNYKEAKRKYNNSKSLYTQAEEFLLEELGLKDTEHNDELYNVVNLSEAKEVGRIDAEYFQMKYEKLMEKCRKHGAKKLGELVSVKKGVEPGSEVYQEEGKLFIRVSNMSKQGLTDNNQKFLTEDFYKTLKDDFEPKVGEILLTKDATPGIAYVLKEAIEGVISGGVLRLKMKEKIDPEYVALCLNSPVGQLQAERDAGGSVIKHWKPTEIKNVLIPILPKSKQEKIAELVKKSHEARKKAKELLEEAKRKVEEMIEEGGEKE